MAERMILSTDFCGERFVVRFEDMSPTGRLTLFKQDDGDIIISAIDEHGGEAHVEFCAPMTGGGQSEATWHALLALYEAMKKDNERPQVRQFSNVSESRS
jgi:hypothetical protein